MNKKPTLAKQLLLQAMLLVITFIVLFPLLWIGSLAIDPRGIARPSELRLIPEGATLQAFRDVIDHPTANPVSFVELAINSLALTTGVSLFSLLLAITAAYTFSRKQFPGRKFMMIGIITVLMLPAIATIAPLFISLNRIRLGEFNLRNSLWGVGLAMTSGALPFAIWNLKGYLDTIPKDLEEAALIDGASPNQVFMRIILPLSVPALAVTFFIGFLGGWTEFALSWQFLTDPKDFTLAMALWNMTGQYAGSVPWSNFAAMSIMITLPVAVIYLMLQKYIVGGLTIGSVK
ncbi:MAG: ABC transporter permease subunit [Methylococcales bacterium]|nr:ABC transporter permease subunit [Methylococcales bacterium]